MTCELAKPGDAAAILRIFKATFDEALLPMIPLGAAGAEKYLEETIANNADTVWLVARAQEVVAFAGFRLGPSGIFINYLHVDPAAHGQRIGTRLFVKSLELLAGEKEISIGLDVDQKNIRARRWYERLGFQAQQTAFWQILPLARGAETGSFVVSGVPQADEIHTKYGFSTLTVEMAGAGFQIGRIGTRYFRATDPGILEYLSVLHTIDPKRELLLITNESHSGGREVSRRDRMSAPVQTVIRNLRKE